ncbi:MAG: efflux RND transporter permease subunit, partial [Nannocystaceae bacterium]|nr:efflux RND transporter permease subunit [Nannocystaceae bacterium]
GDGAEIRTPMAITVISGLAFSTVLTLIVIPTLYAGVDRMRRSGPTLSTAQRLDAELALLRPAQLSAETSEPESESTRSDEPAEASEPIAPVEES